MKNTTYEVKKSEALLKKAKKVIYQEVYLDIINTLLEILGPNFSLVLKELIFGTLMIISTLI